MPPCEYHQVAAAPSAAVQAADHLATSAPPSTAAPGAAAPRRRLAATAAAVSQAVHQQAPTQHHITQLQHGQCSRQGASPSLQLLYPFHRPPAQPAAMPAVHVLVALQATTATAATAATAHCRQGVWVCRAWCQALPLQVCLQPLLPLRCC
jgi:hypothetical protein